jgi:hypothetical protein
MSAVKVKYGRGRFPVAPQKGLCRGCHEPVPKGRKTWCSSACNDKFDPRRVIYFVRQRDKGICQMCGLDTVKATKEWHASRPKDIYSSTGWGLYNAWRRLEPKVNYDHIIPFSEGGLTVLENMRTLCEPCHKERTKQWHKDRKK